MENSYIRDYICNLLENTYNDDLERLKVVAKRLNKQGCDVEITQEVTLFRVVSLNK